MENRDISSLWVVIRVAQEIYKAVTQNTILKGVSTLKRTAKPLVLDA